MKIFNIYHKNCVDGTASACALYKHAIDKGTGLLTKGLGHDYTDSEVLEVVNLSQGYDKIYFTDFTMRLEHMRILLKCFKGEVFVLDHHVGAVEILEKLDDEFENFAYLYDVTKSGAMITWEWFFDKTWPIMISHIQDRDLWTWKLKETKAITSSLARFVDNVPAFYDAMITWEKTLSEGQVLCDVRDKEIDKIFEKIKKDGLLYKEDLPTVQLFNSNVYQSELGNKLSNYTGEPVGIYQIIGEEVHISFRSIEGQTNNSLEYSKSFVGGGHKHASGCKITLDKFFMGICDRELK